MKTKADASLLLYVGGLSLAVVALYWTSFGNGLVFDDARLADGSVFGQYGGLAQLKARWLSYGSFVWVQAIAGENWPAQRFVNVALHLATVFAVYRLLSLLVERTEFPPEETRKPDFAASRTMALRIGVALFALNPVAVYAVAYLIQRSVLMAALFVALGCLAFVRAVSRGGKVWFVAALACYVAAVLSKEHAVTAMLLAVPLYVFVKRPPPKQVAMVAAAALAVLTAAAAALYGAYGGIIGTVFDETSRAYLAQLEGLAPGIGERLYGLSIANQAARFFHYGWFWFVPDVTRMAIDLRPAFPLSYWGWPQTAGAIGYLAVLAGSAWLVLRRSDVAGLAGLATLFPALLFATEFATVWVQDPFVLYRSYLWALTMPLLVALPLVGVKRNVQLAIGVALAAVFAGLTFERILSLRDAQSAWRDAAEKVDLQAPANAVGRWRPWLNLGAELMEKGSYETALRHFMQAESLGEPLGSASYNTGVAQQQLRQHQAALDSFARAEAKGFTEPALYYHRGESQFALGRFADAYASLGTALEKPQVEAAERVTRLRRAEAAVAVTQYDVAIADYRKLIAAEPGNARYQVGLAMAHIGRQDFAAARAILDPLIEKRPSGPAYFARALAGYFAGDLIASRRDLEMALRAEPANPQYRALRERLDAAPAAATKK
jgi:tetratricopeptide (TPR) repeat protein